MKEKIEKEKGQDTFPCDKQKLIYNGKVLENADPLSKYEINEKKFLVVMVPKPQAAPAKPAETPAPAAAPSTDKKEDKKEDEAKESSKPAEKKEESSESEKKMDTSESAPAQEGGKLSSSDLVVGEDYNRMVQNIMDMGYGRDEVDPKSVLAHLRQG